MDRGAWWVIVHEVAESDMTEHTYHFSKFHIYALIYDICFSLSDLLHSV